MNFKYKTLMFVTLFIFCIGSVCATDPNDDTNSDLKTKDGDVIVLTHDFIIKDYKEIKEDNIKLNKYNEKLKEDVKQLNEKVNTLTLDNNQLKTDNNQLFDSMDTLNIKIDLLEVKNNKLQENNTELTKRVSNLEAQNKELFYKLDKKDLEIKQLHDDKDKLNDEIKHKNDEIIKLHDDKDKLNDEIKQRNDEKFNILKELLNRPKTEDLEQVNKLIADKDNQINELNKIIDDKDNQISELKAKIEILNNIFSVSKNDVYNSLKTLTSLEKIQCGKYVFEHDDYLKIPLIKEGKNSIMKYKKDNGRLPNYVTIAGYELPQEKYIKLYNM